MTMTHPIPDDRPLVITDGQTDLFALLCQRRGWTEDYLAQIEDTTHARLADLDAMVEGLEDARSNGLEITIAPDFDMDGIASGVLGYAGLSELGFHVNLHLPDYRRGHDLRPEDIDEIAQHYPDTSILLTCDGGVNSHEGVAAAKARGWTTWITDHHQELEPGSSADLTVDPCRIDETYVLRGICGAHVLYQVIEAYAETHQPRALWAIRLLRLFAGLGTVSDVMPLLNENRQLVRDSLSIARLLHVHAPLLEETNRFGGHDPNPDAIDVSKSTLLTLLDSEDHHPVFISAFTGFALALKGFAQFGKLKDPDDLDEGFYGFYLAPAMNAPRRTGADLAPCFEVFTLQDPDAQLAAMHRVIENNDARKEMVIEHVAELIDGDQPLAPWVYFSSAYTGMYGLLAAKMMQTHGHPVVVMNRPSRPDEFVSGSGRAPAWFEIITALEPIDGLSAIGHQQACGVKVEQASRLDALVDTLVAATQAALLAAGDDIGSPGDLVLGSTDDCDAPLTRIGDLVELVRRIDSMAPFGHGFTRPVVELVLDPARCRLDRIGSDKQHLRIIAPTGMACLWWNSVEDNAEAMESIIGHRSDAKPLRLVAKLQLNVFRGETRLQAVIDSVVDSGDDR